MKIRYLFTGLVLSGLIWAQTTPQLSTADRIAIQQCEQKKAEAQKAYTEAQQNELTILREWSTAHPGFKIDEKTFTVEAEKKPEPKK